MINKQNSILNNNQKGFTLIELLIVITVLGILMSIAVPALSGVKNKADTAVAKSDLHNIMHSLEMSYLDNGEYPSATDGSLPTDLNNLNIKNEISNYTYKIDTDNKNYSISYEDPNGKFYYISTKESSLVGPVDNVPEL